MPLPLTVRQRRIGILLFPVLAALVTFSSAAAAASPAISEPEAGTLRSARTILDLQPFRRTSSIGIGDTRDGKGSATLMNLNPGVDSWYLLRLEWGKEAGVENYHIENTAPGTQKILLDGAHPSGLILLEGKNRFACDLWKTQSRNALTEARASGVAYAPLCGGKLYLRNPARGYRTSIEIVVEFLRDKIPGGEKITAFIRDRFFAEGYREQAKTEEESQPSPSGSLQTRTDDGPAPAWIEPRESGRVIASSHLGIDIRGPAARGMVPGTWYPAKETSGVYVSLITAGSVAPEIFQSYRKVVSSLDTEERDALVYLIAFDLERYDVQFSRGTDHPRLNWSDRIVERVKDASLPGPDGIGTMAPLVSTGMISPADAGRTVAAFTGGFKRTHGAFTWGELAGKNRGSHYGFMEDGVIESALQPGLATIYSLSDGRTEMKTWVEADRGLLSQIVSARQNGVPLIAAFDPASGMSVPGPLVSRWGEGNWSGSIDRKLRTLRSGAALQETGTKRYLIYAVFTSATPSAMARVFQAYRCRYAMLLDMNALEHTYLALYRREGTNLHVQHLIQGMGQVDRSVQGKYLPRFLGYPDNRDFFHLLRKDRVQGP